MYVIPIILLNEMEPETDAVPFILHMTTFDLLTYRTHLIVYFVFIKYSHIPDKCKKEERRPILFVFKILERISLLPVEFNTPTIAAGPLRLLA